MSKSIPKPVTIGKYLDGIYSSLALLAGMQLDVFSVLRDEPRSAEEIAGQLKVDAKQLRFLLYALVAAELLTVSEGRFANTEESTFYLAKGGPGYFGDIHSVIAPMWQAAFLTAETIRTGIPQHKVEYDMDVLPEAEIAAFHGMHKLSMMSVRNLTGYVDFSQHRHIVDIGGGTGAIAIGIAQAFPELQATVVDLPSITSITEQFVQKSPAKSRIRILSENVVKKPLQGNYDAAILRAFTQVLAADDARAAIKNTASALIPGGKMYIVAQVLDDSRSEPAVVALANLAFLSLYEGGQAYTESEYRTWLEDAGFTDVKREMLTRNDTIISATKV